jgi:uncharacterized protein YqhQ
MLNRRSDPEKNLRSVTDADLPEDHSISEQKTASITMKIGSAFYGVGSLAFIIIFIAYFIAHFWSQASESRIAFIGMLFGLFCSFQGLIFILIAKTAEARRQQTDFILDQIRINKRGG